MFDGSIDFSFTPAQCADAITKLAVVCNWYKRVRRDTALERDFGYFDYSITQKADEFRK